MSNNSTKKSTTFHQTVRNQGLISGVLLSLVLITTPFLFYLYKYAPGGDIKEWETFFGTVRSGNFPNVQTYFHAMFTKVTLVLITGIWFLTSTRWWKYAILVPFTMFLFQLSGVINHKLKYIDEYDFWYSLPLIIPIILLLIYISYRLRKNSGEDHLSKKASEELKNIFSDEL